MKFFGILLLALAIACAAAQEITKEKIEAMAEACQKETNASEADMLAVMKHDAGITPEAKCLRACMMKNFGILNEEGKIVPDAAIAVIQVIFKDDEEKQKKGVEMIQACVSAEVADDQCEAAEEYNQCFVNKAVEMGVSLSV